MEDTGISKAVVCDPSGLSPAEEMGEILERSLNEIYLFHPETSRFVHVNRAARENLRYSMDELRGLTPLDLEPELTPEAFGDRMAPLRGQPRTAVDFTAVQRRKDGSLYPVEVRLQCVTFRAEPVFLAVMLDIGERRRLETRLRQAQKLASIGELAAGVAHEINTPMQFVGDNLRFLEDAFRELGQLEKAYALLLEEARRGPVSRERLARVERSLADTDREFLLREIPSGLSHAREGVRRVKRILRAMKEFSHPGRGEVEPTDLSAVIESALTIATSEWKHVAEVVTDFADDLSAVPCFRQELGQAILNLVVNAAHAIADAGRAAKGTITVSTRRLEDGAEIRVADTGTGIPEAVRAQVFDPFFTTKDVGRGTGQGLAIAYRAIVTQHGGKLSFETETGRGTIFIVRLPLASRGRSLRT